MRKVLFVCLGNICRSPMGEGVFQFLVENEGLSSNYYIDSAGTSAYHVGQRADHRMRNTAAKYGFDLESRARQVVPEDFDEFEVILAMDESNLSDLNNLAESNGKESSHLFLMRKFDQNPDNMNVPDPYYGSDDGFEEVYEIMNRSCTRLLDYLEGK